MDKRFDLLVNKTGFREKEGIVNRMIYGIGTDMVEISRLEKTIQNKSFLQRFYTEREQQLILSRKSRVKAAAINFAGKEAVSKALRTGITRQVHLEEIEILREESGAPYVTLYGKTLEYSKDCEIERVHISLSDTEEYAIAYAVAECKERA